jgi:SAM-dependent methyltransferase
LRHVKSWRTGAILPLYHCEACESFAMPSTYDQASDPGSLRFHKRVLDRNLTWSRDLWRLLRRLRLPRETVVEVGCGSGATLHVAAANGAQAFGYDLDQVIAEWGSQELGVEIRARAWDGDHPPADLVLCISVIEHLNEPDTLLAEFADYCAEHSAILCASVPLHGPETFRHVSHPYRDESPFRAGDTHVMYYSPKGFRALLRRAGAEFIFMRRMHGWRMHFVAFDEDAAARLRRAARRVSDLPARWPVGRRAASRA